MGLIFLARYSDSHDILIETSIFYQVFEKKHGFKISYLEDNRLA